GTTDDSFVEATETFTVTLAKIGRASCRERVTTSIIDNDTSTIALTGPTTVGEGATTGAYTVSLSNSVGLGAGQSLTCRLDRASGTATEGSDFSALVSSSLTPATNIALTNITTGAGGVITVTATNNGANLISGSPLLTFTIGTTDDSFVEATETFTVTLA